MALKEDSRPTYTILMGCPASGKSTWASKQKGVRLNRDDMRRTLFDFGQWSEYKFTKAKETRVTLALDEDLRDAAFNGVSVVDDNTNLNSKYLAQTKAKAEKLGFRVVFKQFFDVPLHKLIERNLNRAYSVPEVVIHDMFRKQLEIQGRVITPTEGLPECVIVDVDGTIADMGKGEKWGRMPYDWDKVGNDRPKPNVVSFVQSLVHDKLTGKRGCPKVIFLTGRDGIALKETKSWIVKEVFPSCEVFREGLCEIFIRTPDDTRPDCDIKEELLRNEILPRFNVKYAIDDRAQICWHYRALGLEVWQVDNGFF